jgi:hypothetical protein
MGIELGRISGPLLARDLVRKNSGAGEENLAFETNLLFLDVINGRVGINTDTPSSPRKLDVSGTTGTNDLLVPTQFSTPNFVFSTDRIQNLVNKIYIQPDQTTDPKIVMTKIGTANLRISDQLIENITNGSDINFSPNGDGITEITSSELYVDGELHATGDITWDGNITFGNNDADNVEFSADINSHIVPNINQTYDLGTAGKRWNKIYTKDLTADSLTYSTITINDINLLLTQGNTYYVSVNGNDTYVGDHLHNTYRTIKYALSQATAGDTVTIFPGVYEEIFPLTVPAGVTVNGAGIRAVTVKPIAGTNSNNAFLLNGETTVSNLTVKDFNAPGSAFSFANNFTVTSRSPYVQNVTVITTAPTVASIDWEIITSQTQLVTTGYTNGFLYNFLTSVDPLSGFKYGDINNSGTITSADSRQFFLYSQDPEGTNPTTYNWCTNVLGPALINLYATYPAAFIIGAGNGASVDGSLANSASREASMLFHSVTFIVPGSTGVKATNGARVEWLNSFTYFAGKGLYLEQGTYGFANLGVKYGAELRSIGSANVYGTYGAVADGADTLAYLISHNFAYIGVNLDTSNDPRLVVQANEVVESNGGRIHYESVDHKGDFRIGDIFYVNQETGAVVFDAQAITFSPTGSISLEGPTSNAYIDYSVVQVGNIRIYNNNIDSLIGPVNFLANSGSTYLNTNVFVTGDTTVSADIAVDGNLFLGNESTDTITVFSNLTQSLLPDNVGGPFTLGTDSTRWNSLYATLINVDGATRITNNTISTLTTNTNLILSAAGTGQVQITNTDVTIANDLTVGNTLTVNGDTDLKTVSLTGNILLTGDWDQTGVSNAYITGLFANNNIEVTGSSYFSVPNIKLYNSEISVTATDTSLNFTGLGTGGIVIDEKLKFKDSTISNVWTSPTTDTQKSVILQPNGTGSVVINSNKALTIPVGNLSTRTIGIGEIRYNNVTNIMEGGGSAGLISFNGLYDSDRNTYIRAGATDNTIYFGINGTELVNLNSTRLYTSLYHVDNISLSGNTINNRVSGNDLIFAPNGTGNTVLDGVAFGNGGNTITNLSSGALTLTSTGIGFVKFTGTGGLVLPRGTSAERRPSPEVGETRYNTTDSVTEVYSGDPFLGDDGWIPAIGTSGEISAEDVLDLLEIYTLVLG